MEATQNMHNGRVSDADKVSNYRKLEKRFYTIIREMIL